MITHEHNSVIDWIDDDELPKASENEVGGGRRRGGPGGVGLIGYWEIFSILNLPFHFNHVL